MTSSSEVPAAASRRGGAIAHGCHGSCSPSRLRHGSRPMPANCSVGVSRRRWFDERRLRPRSAPFGPRGHAECAFVTHPSSAADSCRSQTGSTAFGRGECRAPAARRRAPAACQRFGGSHGRRDPALGGRDRAGGPRLPGGADHLSRRAPGVACRAAGVRSGHRDAHRRAWDCRDGVLGHGPGARVRDHPRHPAAVRRRPPPPVVGASSGSGRGLAEDRRVRPVVDCESDARAGRRRRQRRHGLPARPRDPHRDRGVGRHRSAPRAGGGRADWREPPAHVLRVDAAGAQAGHRALHDPGGRRVPQHRVDSLDPRALGDGQGRGGRAGEAAAGPDDAPAHSREGAAAVSGRRDGPARRGAGGLRSPGSSRAEGRCRAFTEVARPLARRRLAGTPVRGAAEERRRRGLPQAEGLARPGGRRGEGARPPDLRDGEHRPEGIPRTSPGATTESWSSGTGPSSTS